MAFIDELRGQGHAVESICRVLREQGCQVAARTYRAWRKARPCGRDVEDAYLINAIVDACWQRREGRKVATPVIMYGRRKMTGHLRRTIHPTVSHTRVARCLKLMGHQGIRRVKKVRTTVQSNAGVRAEDLLGRNFTATAPDTVWVTDFTYVDLGRVRLCGVHPGRLLPPDRGLARLEQQTDRPGDDAAADGAVAAGP